MNTCIIRDCNVFANGTVECILPCEFSIYCADPDYSDWPFDYTTCAFNYMSRTKSLKKLNFIGQYLSVDYERATQNRAWELVSFLGTISNQTNELMKYSEEPNALYSCLTLRFVIGRHSKEFVVQVMIPAVLMIFINILTLLLDADQPERWMLYATYLFSHSIYFEQLQWMLPSNSDSVPNVFLYYCSSLYVTVFLLVESILMKAFIETPEMSQTIMAIIDKSANSIVGQFIVQKGSTDNSDKTILRRNFCCFVDKLLIIFLILFYGYKFIALMPKSGINDVPYDILFENEY